MIAAMNRRYATVPALLLPAVLAILVGWPGVDGTFVRDDWLFVPLNPHVVGDVSLGQMFSSPFQPDQQLGLFRPVTTLSLALDWRAAGESPRRYHLVNLTLNAVAALALAALLMSCGLPAIASGGAAAWFAVHAARSEAVLWISGRAEMLMTAFVLLSLLTIRAGRGGWRWPVAAILAALALASKEQGLVVAALAPLLPGLSRRERALAIAWTWVPLGLVMAWRQHVLGGLGPSGMMQVFPDVDVWTRAQFGLRFLTQYAGLALWPQRLINEYDDPEQPVGWIWIVAGCAILSVAAALAAMRRPRATFGACIFLGALAPVLNVLYRTGETFAERFLSLPLAGVAWLVACALARLSDRRPWIALAIVVVITAPLAGRFVGRARDWVSQDALFAAQLRDAPDVGGSHQLIAASLLDDFGLRDPKPDDVVRAAKELERAVELAPHRVDVMYRLGQSRLRAAAAANPADPRRVTDLREAEKLFRKAVDVAPSIPELRGALGLVLILEDRKDEAIPILRDELARNPREFRAATNLSAVLDERGQHDEAKGVRQRALTEALAYADAHPDDPGPVRVAAQLCLDMGNLPQAAALANRALACVAPGRPRAASAAIAATTIEAAAVLQRAGRDAEARRALQEARDRLDAAAAQPGAPLADLFGWADLQAAIGETSAIRPRLAAAHATARGLELRQLDHRLKTLK